MPRDDRPVSVRLAERLRRAIQDGTYPPGSRLPTIAELIDSWGVSHGTVRRAIAQLAADGLVDTRYRAGTIVRSAQPVRRLDVERYRDVAHGRLPTAEAHVTTTVTGRVVGADDELAELLAVEAGAPVLRRVLVRYAGDRAEEIAHSYMPTELVGALAAAEADRPWPGGPLARLVSLGRPVTRIEEAVGARMPTPEEKQLLRLGEGIPVVAVRRRMLCGDRVGEVARDIVRPADRFTLDYSIDLWLK
ncbi:transcriptional regulator [Microtetraspora sp. NBRC 13810]|uniref:GntR family transcriptional regulator n=1 Tax=Microtetraspora sp. NBRC 13810 TaxID=3030990 RepID=UPI0025562996|nr:GntR family transcriptional regulator [Microtetraspora sp. NBRC 13810]GLW10107.1 transcriptional regulator [Microtetraspora sp. NBRC 13810]